MSTSRFNIVALIASFAVIGLLGITSPAAKAASSSYPFKVGTQKKIKKQKNKIRTSGSDRVSRKHNPRRTAPLAMESASILAKPAPAFRSWAISGEVFGRGGLYSLNVDYSFIPELTVGMGFSYQSLTVPVPEAVSMISADVISIPFYGNFYPLAHPHHRPFVTGGITLLSIDVRSEDVNVQGEFNGESAGLMIRGMDIASGTLPVPTLGGGYEYRSVKGFLFRGQALVMYVGKIQPTAGLALGYSF